MGEPGREREGGQGERREGQEGVRGSVGEEGERERAGERRGTEKGCRPRDHGPHAPQRSPPRWGTPSAPPAGGEAARRVLGR